VRLVELDRVVVRELLSGTDVADGHDPHLVPVRDRLAVRFAGVIDEPGLIPADVRIDHPFIVEREEVGVLRLL